jgi:homoserine dehydrogenase
LKELRLGIAGLGVVAQGLLSIIQNNGQLIAQRTGTWLKVVRVASRTEKPEVDLLGASFSKSVDELWKDPDVDVIVELMGGVDTARDLIVNSLNNGKKVATANKAVIALHGDELINDETTGRLKFEASVAGAIPIIQMLQKALVANQFAQIVGIINGTCNYILTAMQEKSLSFDSALQKAQELGFAEADPSFDIDGIDAAHKLTILLSLAFGRPFDFEKIYVEGITSISEEDIRYAEELGYQIKHVGIIKNEGQLLEARVHPALIPKEQLLASVLNEQNAVHVKGDSSGDMLFSGPGAGSLPTASAVVSDLVAFATDDEKPISETNIVESINESSYELVSMDRVCVPHYLRILTEDKPGIMAKITSILSEFDISIEAVIQKGLGISLSHVSVVILSNAIRESVMREAVANIESLSEVSKGIVDIRIENMSQKES